MKLNRKHLRKMILQEMSRDQIPPHLRVEDGMPDRSGGSLRQIVENMVDEIEGSHGGLDTKEAAEELIRRLDASGSHDVPELLAEMLLSAVLELRGMSRR